MVLNIIPVHCTALCQTAPGDNRSVNEPVIKTGYKVKD